MGEHEWEHVYFKKFTWCTFCGEFIWGVHKKQGYKCHVCKGCSHGKCRANAGPCPGIDVHKGKSHSGQVPDNVSRPPEPERQAPSPPPPQSTTSTRIDPTPAAAPAAVAPVANSPPPVPAQPIHTARAVFDFPPENARELELKKGDIIEVLKVDEEWWFGVLSNGNEGYFPGNYVEKIGNW